MADVPPARAHAWRPRDVALLAGLVALYVAAGRFGLSLAFVNSSASAVWPPTGLAIGALVVLGLRFWPAVALGAFLVNWANGGWAADAVAPSALIAGGNALEGWLGAWAILQWAGGPKAFDAPASAFRAFAAAVAAALVSATIGAATLLTFGLAPATAAADVWLTWLLGDAAGAVVLAPVLVTWLAPPSRGRAGPVESLLALALLGLVAGAIWGPLWPALFAGRPFTFVSMPFILWIALRGGPRMAAAAALLLDAVAIWGTLHGHGPFAGPDPNGSLLYLQSFILIVALIALPTSALALAQERSRSALEALTKDLERQVEQRTAELSASREALRTSLDTVTVAELATGRGSWEWDVTVDRAKWSEGMYHLFGLDPRTFSNTNENFLALVHPDDRARMGQAIADALADPGPFRQEYRLRRPDGHEIHVRGEGNVVTDDDGKPAHLFGYVQDVTELRRLEQERARAEQTVAESEQRLRAIFTASPVGILITRPDGRVVDLNPAAEELWGRTRAEFLSPTFRTERLFADPSQREPVVRGLREKGHERGLELTMLRGDGSRRQMSFSVAVVDLAGEKVFLSTGIDITDLRAAETRLRESEARLRAVLDNASDAVITGDGTATIVGWNRAAERIFGYSEPEAMGRSIASLLPPAQWEDYQRDITQFLQGKPSTYIGRPREMQAVRKGGGSVDVELSLGVWQSSTGPMFTGVVRDITARKKAQEETRRAQERFATVFELSPVPIALSKEDGRFVDANAAYCDLVGHSKEHLLSGALRAQELWADPDERQRLIAHLRERGLVRDMEVRIRRADGAVRTTLANLEFVDVGGSTTILTLLQDMTERKRLEDERAARIQDEAELERLRRTDRFRTEFINSTAHELATPLTPLVLTVKTLVADQRLNDGQRHAVGVLDRNITRLRHLVDDMVGAADLQARTLAIDRRRLNLTRELRAAVAAHQAQAERAGLALQEPADTGLTVSADPARLQLVMGHLLGNAIKFTPAGGRVAVASRRLGEEVRIEVSDTGTGLTRHQMEQLWKPFSQAHDKSQRTVSGSGLGLYVVKGIVELHGGEVGCTSPGPGKGSTFWFTLPLATGHVDPLSRPAQDGVAGEPRRDLNPGAHADR